MTSTLAEEDLVGRTVLGRYRVVMPLGRGGQGMVYLARGEGAAGFARPVVVKRVLAPFAADPQVLEQFAREARITSQLRHPDIVSVIDFERDGVSYVMVLEYVHGYDLRRWERFVVKERKRFPADIVAYVMARMLDALHYAHTLRAPDGSPRSVIHRDISPANVLVDLDGHIKLTDFGIARMDAEEVTVVTSGMQIKGKLPYVAPELFRGAQPSVATDLYACGVMLHELLLGRNEFRAANALETLALATEHIPSRVDKERDDVSKAFADVVAKALEKKPEKRFKSAAEFAQALRDVLSEPLAEVEARFRAMLRQDFLNPEMARYLQAPQLTDLDAAWRNAPEATGKITAVSRTALQRGTPDNDAGPPELPLVTGPTIIDSPLAQRSRSEGELTTESTRPTPKPNLALYAVAVAVVLLSVVLGLRDNAPEAPKFVYVQRETASTTLAPEPSSATNTSPPAAMAPDVDEVFELEETEADQAEADEPSGAVKASDKRKTARELAATQAEMTSEQARAVRMSQAFAQKRPQVERCFAEHQADVGTNARVEVQFAVDRKGKVTRASLVPERLTKTDFGRCVIKAAESTLFGPQPSDLVFRIPVTARVLP